MRINQQAWAILLEDEKTALNLQYGHDKSTWQAGEIMEKAHYKYLEIKYRAEYLLKLFTTHFQLYDAIIPLGLHIPKEIQKFVEIAITERIQVKEIYSRLNTEFGYTNKKQRDKDIINWVTLNRDRENLILTNTIALILEFDRWNNFRILPKEIQEPSAYKRRNKNTHRKHIKAISKLTPLALDIIHKTLSCKTPTGFYAVVLSLEKEPKVFNLRKNLIKKTTELGIYIWPNKELAKDYGNIVREYILPHKKHCKEGLLFWPAYRDLSIKATNYMEIQKLSITRKYLEMAAAKLEFYNH